MGSLQEMADAFSEVEKHDYRVKTVEAGEAAAAEMLGWAFADVTSARIARETGTIAFIWGADLKKSGGPPWHVSLTPEEDPSFPAPGEMVRTRCMNPVECDEPECVVRGVLES